MPIRKQLESTNLNNYSLHNLPATKLHRAVKLHSMSGILLLATCFFIASCGTTSVPDGIKPVQGFDLQRYLGTWFEIARLDHRFERNLGDVSATYSLNDDGTVKVLNSGVYVASSKKAGKRNSATGKAKFVGDRDTGHLKVSFFGPFYGDYIIFDLDKTDYSRAYISGGKDNYLWLLSRTPTITDSVRRDFLAKSEALGYETDSLIWVDHSSPQTK